MHQVPTRFTAYEFTEQEITSALNFSATQLAYIQTLIAGYAEDMVNLSYDPSSPMKFVQDQAANRGAINALEHLINLSSATKTTENS